MPELDALRGIAVLAVFAYHGFFWSAAPSMTGVGRLLVRATQPGWAGVDLFFVLSGFLITGILVDGRRSATYFRRFYVRRVLRLWPAYFALVAILAVTRTAGGPFLLLSTLFLANTATLFGVPFQYGPLWSLAVEEQFYLVWPFLCRSVEKRTLAVVAAAIVAMEPLARWIAFRSGHAEGLYFFTWFRLDGLGLGALVALLVRSSPSPRRRIRFAAIAFGCAAALVSAAGAGHGIGSRTHEVGAALQLTVIALASASCLCWALLAGTNPRLASRAHPRVLTFFGEISYGLYLVHVLAFESYDRIADVVAPHLADHGNARLLLLRFLVAGGVAVGLSVLSRRYYEERFLRLKNRFA